MQRTSPKRCLRYAVWVPLVVSGACADDVVPEREDGGTLTFIYGTETDTIEEPDAGVGSDTDVGSDTESTTGPSDSGSNGYVDCYYNAETGLMKVEVVVEGVVDGDAFDGTYTLSVGNEAAGNLCVTTWTAQDLASSPLPATEARWSGASACVYEGVECAFAFDVAVFAGQVSDASVCDAFGVTQSQVQSSFVLPLGLAEELHVGTFPGGEAAVYDLTMYYYEDSGRTGVGGGWFPLYDSFIAAAYYGSASGLEGDDATMVLMSYYEYYFL